MAKTKLGFSTGKGFIEKVDKAKNADNSTYASSAGSASSATNTDFTNKSYSVGKNDGTLILSTHGMYHFRRGGNTDLGVIYWDGSMVAGSISTDAAGILSDDTAPEIFNIVIDENGKVWLYYTVFDENGNVERPWQKEASSTNIYYKQIR